MTGMAFQQFNLFPHLTALQNVTLGLLKVKKMHKDQAVALAEKWLERVGLLERRNHFPGSCPAVSNSAWRLPGRLR